MKLTSVYLPATVSIARVTAAITAINPDATIRVQAAESGSIVITDTDVATQLAASWPQARFVPELASNEPVAAREVKAVLPPQPHAALTQAPPIPAYVVERQRAQARKRTVKKATPAAKAEPHGPSNDDRADDAATDDTTKSGTAKKTTPTHRDTTSNSSTDTPAPAAKPRKAAKKTAKRNKRNRHEGDE